MNFLALCVKAWSESGYSGAGPTTVIAPTGQHKRMVGWVQQGWEDIQQMRPNWNFMNKEFTFDTVANTRDYLAADYSITDMKLWDVDSFMIYETALGTTDQEGMINYSYQQWRAAFRIQMEARAAGRPQNFTILPTNKVRFEPKPDKIYTIDGEYKRSTQSFAADADVPTSFPDDFHIMIVWQALKYYGFHENAPEVLDEAEVAFDTLLLRLEIEQLPAMSEDYAALA